ncbi:hypothetical protein ElyMa_001481800 [Elysia marginata]|uniref:Uncharacterized protein n=1 Tax=Elysia marginata TaxID=1093978 RepID=A0AAV4J4J7_9GAST|nr:hypothetical protein ElyMa_001481800 [Elysia marginata]
MCAASHAGTIMCSTCRSDTNPKCEIEPPPPQPCVELGSAGVESCSTVRIFNDETGSLSAFRMPGNVLVPKGGTVFDLSKSSLDGAFDIVL